MTTLIIGIPDSGKSALAEKLACRYRNRFYIATMVAFGEEGEKRIQKHRRAREGKHFTTIECPTDIGQLANRLASHRPCSCLVECVSNLVGNELYADLASTDEALLEKITQSVKTLSDAVDDLILVTNEFLQEDSGYDEETKRYVRLTSMVNWQLSDFCDRIYRYDHGEFHPEERQ
ncbi:adenosylcobinamide kinase /adenosylcobinamide-phosphate guanylyltransferase [Lachnospiraceae bacterium KHCPX20]|nr:adenosylcobinamide kinase /adenosylcobinamide-phosphate guanylyltransferase [Lachnospiraceae bacterium KHCPX20]